MASFQCLDCGTEIPGSNCAYMFCYEEQIKNVPGCYAHCPCGYPVRAKEVKQHIFPKEFDKDQTQEGYFYCEDSNGNGHVYKGTWDSCESGNDFTAEEMDPAYFERHFGKLQIE